MTAPSSKRPLNKTVIKLRMPHQELSPVWRDDIAALKLPGPQREGHAESSEQPLSLPSG